MLGQSHLVSKNLAADVASHRGREARVGVDLEMLPELVKSSERLVAEGAAVLLLLLLLLLLRDNRIFVHVLIIVIIAPCNFLRNSIEKN